MIGQLLPYLCVAPSLAYGLFALACGRRFFQCSAVASSCHAVPVTILKPVAGADPESFNRLATFCCQDYPEYQLLFSAAAADDPAIAVVRDLMAAFPERDIGLVVDPRRWGANRKVDKLCNAWPQVRHNIVIVSDSDVRVGPTYLREVSAPFLDQQVGLVTSPYRNPEPRGMAETIEALGFTTELLPNVIVARRIEGLSFALGASMAIRRQALEEIGGFPVLAGYLADDYQLGYRIRQAGWRVELSNHVVDCVAPPERSRQIMVRQLRWARTIRASRPGGYFFSVVTQPLPAAGLALFAANGSSDGFVAMLLLYLARALVATVYSRQYAGDRLLPRRLWLLPLRDLCTSVTWLLAFLGNRVIWRGQRYRIRRGGLLEELDRRT